MVALLLILAFLGQGIPIPQEQGGIITGTLKADDGKPVAGVRVAVLAVPERVADISYATAMTSQGETDKDGHFRLENIPPGRYYITAGRVDYPTYFPGTQDITTGKIVTVKAGDLLEGVEFAMNAVATRPPDAFGLGGIAVSYVPSAAVTFKMSIDGGGALPVFSPSGSFTSVRVVSDSNKREYRVPFSEVATKGVSIPQQIGTAPTEYRVVLENLPEGFAAQSIRTGNVDLSKETLKIPPSIAPGATVTKTPATATTAASLQGQLQSYLATLATVSANSASTPSPQFEIQIILKKAPRPSSNGVRVSGRISNTEPRSIYLSGKPGTLYTDGTFEFFDVAPGRHNITTPDNPSSTRPQGACVIVGTQDLSGIQLIDSDAATECHDTIGTRSCGNAHPRYTVTRSIQRQCPG